MVSVFSSQSSVRQRDERVLLFALLDLMESFERERERVGESESPFFGGPSEKIFRCRSTRTSINT